MKMGERFVKIMIYILMYQESEAQATKTYERIMEIYDYDAENIKSGGLDKLRMIIAYTGDRMPRTHAYYIWQFLNLDMDLDAATDEEIFRRVEGVRC